MKSTTVEGLVRPSPSKVLLLISTGLLILTLLMVPRITQAMEPGGIMDAGISDAGIRDAWELARESGSYAFSADIRQTTGPQPTVRNVGRATKIQTMHLEGETDLPKRQLHLTLWSQGGSVLNNASGIKIKVEGERAYARQGTGDWEEINNFTGLFAPQGDFMAFLAAAKDVTRLESDHPGLSGGPRYRFRIDGRSYAAHMRDQMEEYLAEEGELPPGLSLDLPGQYVDMTGQGELWLDADGYPLRQILHLDFPPGAGEEDVHTEVTVDFSGFPETAASSAPIAVAQVASAVSHSVSALPFLLVGGALCIVLVVHARSRRLYGGLALLIIASIILTPLMRSAHAAEFARRRAADAEAAEAREREGDMERTLRRIFTESDPRPNVDPLAGQSFDVSALENDPVSIVGEPFLAASGDDSGDNAENDDDANECDPDDPADTDDDGLSEGNECVLGTNHEVEDSDGDGVSDGDEIAGFEYDGKSWYADPLEMDTNGDGLGDGVEWNTGRGEGDVPPDTDEDGTPDLFDRDNDGDGVPDKLDLSPYYKGDATFTEEDPFRLIVDDLEEGVPTFVEFQLRPTNPDHLWYAMNVLDWPQGDLQGQIQDEDGATFYDVDNGLDPNPNDNGDVKLVPMLEIKISGEPDNLPPAEECTSDDGDSFTCYPDLEPYGVFVQELNHDGDKAAYVPLQLVVDRTGGEHVAFAGKMHYLPAAEWGSAHQVTLVWLVKALVDVCERYEDGRCVEYKEMNRTQVIHSYGDEWFLTGIDVREDHGADYGVIYEAPSVDEDLADDSTLLYLTYGLEKTFLAGSDCEDIDDKGTEDPDDDECIGGDGERDITVDEIFRRWNNATNGGVSDNKRWSLDDHLSVVTHTYETMDSALATLAMTDTKEILDDTFTAYTPVTPTLLFAREERFRGVNLDQHLDDDVDVVQWSDDDPHQLTLVLSQEDAPLDTVAGVNWAPFRYKDDAWEAYPIEAYWDELHERYTAAFADEYGDDEDPEAARGGGVIVGQTHYLALYGGVSVTVQSGDELLTQKDYQTYDKPLWSVIAKAGGKGVVFVVNKIVMRSFYQSTLPLKALYQLMQKQRFFRSHNTMREISRFGRAVKNKISRWLSSARGVKTLGAVTIMVIVTLVVAIIAFSHLIKSYMANNPTAVTFTAVLVGALLFGLTVLVPIFQTVNLITTIRAVKGLSTLAATSRVLRASSKFIGMSKAVGVVGLIIGAGIAWGIFIYALVTEDIPANSVAFDMLLAQTIAATIVAILIFALSLTIVGTIIVAIVTMVDIVLIILGSDWTITRWATDVITKAIFSYELAIDVEAADLVAMGALDSAFVDPGSGMVEGAEMEFSTTLTSTITHQDPKDWRTRFYMWLYDEDQLRSTTFKYDLAPTSTSLSADLGDVSGEWNTRYDHKFWGRRMYTGWKRDSPSAVTTLKTGINSQVDLKLTSAFAVPGVECWTLVIVIPFPPIYVPVPVCFEKGVDDAGSDDVGPIVLDVLPPTLDDFVDVTAWTGGSYPLAFPDADGDGLLAASSNGNDPDGTIWDTDGDGLSDAWELERSSVPADEGGQFYDPRDPDTDDDGLTDGEEARLGTNPNNADSDGDTISDYGEVGDGWTFTYAEGKSLRVYSDPLDADADGDGLDDRFERTLHTCPDCEPLENRFYPYVWNTSPIGLYTELGDPDEVVRPTQTFAYTTTVANQLQPDLWVRGMTEMDPALLTGGPLDMYFDIARDQTQALYSDLTVPSNASNQDVEVTTKMEAQLHTPSVWAWDPPQVNSTTAGAQPDGVAVTPVDKWTVPYVVTTLEGDRVYAYPATADGVTGSPVHVMGWTGDSGNGAPDVACGGDGLCLVVWTSHYGPDGRDYVRWRRLSPTLNVEGEVETVTAPAGVQTYGGAVAAGDGGFLATWAVGDTLSRQLFAGPINAYGQVSSPTLTLDQGAIGGMDVTHAFDRYHVVWERDGDLFAAEVYGTRVTTTTVAATTIAEAEPRIAYDPLSRRSLIVYRQARGESNPYPHLLARTFAGGHVGEPTTLSQIGAPGTSLSPAVAADPVNGGWVVAWRPEWEKHSALFYQAVGMGGELRGRKDYFWTDETPAIDLGCARPRPVAELLFDEGSGATTFADSSGFDNEGTCTDDGDYDCPLAGAGGKNGNGVQFDGTGDIDQVFVPLDASESAYAVTLWFKATCQDCGMFEVSSDAVPGTGGYEADRALYLQNGDICARLGSGDGERICSSSASYGDGNWHHLAHTFGGAVGGQRLYVDGELVASGRRDVSDFEGGDRLRIGYGDHAYGGAFTGVLDEVTLYPRALSEGEVHDAYRAPLVVYPFDEVEGASRFENAAENGYGASCEGDACPTAGVAGRAYAAAEFDGTDDVLIVGNQERTVAEYVYDFEGAIGSGWSTARRDTTPADARGFLGRFGDESVTLDLSNLPTHDEIEVTFDLYVIRTWDGNETVNDNGPDTWSWYADGERQLRTTFSNYSPPYHYQFYPDEPWTPSGVTLKGTTSWLGSQRSWHFTDDEPDVEPDIWDTRDQVVEDDTVAWAYPWVHYGGEARKCDGKRDATNGTACEFLGEPDSIRVWAAANPGGTGAVERNALGYDRDAVYRIEGSFDHLADTFQLRFEGDHLESVDNESWGLDNVGVRVINRNVPLTNRSFTAAFWARRDGEGADYVITQGDASANQGLHIGFREDGRFTCAFHSDDLNSDATPADGEWHHWACTYDADTNERIIYRDGQSMAQDIAGADYQGSGQLQIGRGLWDGTHAFRGRLDEVVIWPDPLSAGEIESLYDKVKAMDDSVTECTVAQGQEDDARLHVNRLAVRETTTFLGKAEQETSDTITIDATEPEASITSLADGDVLNVTGTLVVGGEARDNTFVTRVELSVDGGPWEEVDGVETWTYAWDTAGLSEGSHTIRARARDAGGNVETSPASVTVEIDRTPSQMAADPPPQKAGQDADGNWLVPLSGTVSDTHPDTVEVLLRGTEGAAAGFGWQPAAVSGGSWSLNYRLSDFDNAENAVVNPTGIYTLSLRAEDVPGNWTPEAAYPPTVNLDNTAPETALTFPVSDTAALTDTTRLITGVITDTGSVAHGAGGVEIALVDSEQDPSVFEWQDAVLTNPGDRTSTWTYALPPGMEGFYEIYVRGTDVVGNRNDKESTWQVWQGIIDTRDPYVDALADYGVMGEVSYTGIDSSDVITYTDVRCQARDLTLNIDRFAGCPCDESTWELTTYDQVSSWYRNTFSDTTHLYQVDANCLLEGQFATPPTVHAYDAAGRHSQTALTETVSVRLLDSAILTPTDGIVLTTTETFTVEGRAVAAPYGIDVVTVTVNGDLWQTHLYGGAVTGSWFDPFDSVAYNAPGDGRYRFLSVVQERNNPEGNRIQTLLHPVTITVDSLSPTTPTFDTTVFTTAHRAEAWPVFLTGVVSDIVGLDRVETNQDGEGWIRAAHDGIAWRARWTQDDITSDDVDHIVSVRAVDLVSRTTQATETITFDVVPPAFVTPTLAYQDPVDPQLYHPVDPEQTITDSHTLRVSWPPSDDGAGVRWYQAGWTTVPTPTTDLITAPHDGSTAYTVTQVISEAQAVYAHVVPVDYHGNRQKEVVGPVYVDSPLTPDYIALGDGRSEPYHGWMSSGCSLIGVDRRVETHALDGASLEEPQRFYATWGEEAMRLVWEGANWDHEGDLFVYFDTVSGGAETLYAPYTSTMTNTAIYLPGNLPPVDTSGWPEFEEARRDQLTSPLLNVSMKADTLVWVRSSESAVVLHWDGAGWGSETELTFNQYRWDDGLTDLYVPFSTLGITDPNTAPVSLVAVASEEDALRLWATMPDRNLVSSDRVVNPTAAVRSEEEQVFVLTRPYLWSTLGSGICPNDPLQASTGSTYPDSDLQVDLQADPVGTTFAFMGDDLYHEWRAFYQDEGPGKRQFDFLDHSHPPVGDGDTVTYTLRINNEGRTDAVGVKALVSAYYALTLPGAIQDTDGYREYEVLDVGSVPAGATVTATVAGTIDPDNWRYSQCLSGETAETCQPLRDWATLQGEIFHERAPLTLTNGLATEPPSEWVWADHRVDNAPPEHVGIDGPQTVVRPGTRTVYGYASDPSGVPLVEVEVRDPTNAVETISCADPTPHDGRWSCDWTVSGADGDAFELRARATDGYGHDSAWSSPPRVVVLDSTPPTMTIDVEARQVISGQLIGPEGYLVTGVFTDSHSPADVEVCRDTAGGTACDPATVVVSTHAPDGAARLYGDVPAAPVAVGAACLTRTFTVDDDFFAADVDLGFNVATANREELVVDLFSPAGTATRVIDGLGNDANAYAHYDVWLDDAARRGLHNSADDDPSEPYFDRAARPDEPLGIFNGEPVSGTWILRVCDLLPSINPTEYRQARLALTPQMSSLVSAGRWGYELPTPAGVDGVEQTLTFYSLDALGNRLDPPLALNYRLDTVAPALTVTEAASVVRQGWSEPLLAGTVSDGEGLEAVYLRVDPPDGASYRGAAETDGNTWSYAPAFTQRGQYTLWLEAYDRAGNVTVDGPHTVMVAPHQVYLAHVAKQHPPRYQTYLPLVCRVEAAGAGSRAPGRETRDGSEEFTFPGDPFWLHWE